MEAAAERLRRDQAVLEAKKKVMTDTAEIDGDAQMEAMGVDWDDLVHQKEEAAAAMHACPLCGFKVPEEEMARHALGHESPILEAEAGVDGRATPWLFLGRHMNIDPATMHRRGITHIINVSCAFHVSDTTSNILETNLFRENLALKRDELGDQSLDFIVRSFNWDDTAAFVDEHLLPNVTRDRSAADYDHRNSIEAATQLIHEIHEQHPRTGVLVHCSMGISRSASTIIAYLMQYNGMTLREAWEHTLARRSIIRPNAGFLSLLGALERKLRPEDLSVPTLTDADVYAREEADSPDGHVTRVAGTFDAYAKA